MRRLKFRLKSLRLCQRDPALLPVREICHMRDHCRFGNEFD